MQYKTQTTPTQPTHPMAPPWNAAERMQRLLDNPDGSDISSHHASYKRLANAARIMHGIRGEAALAKALQSNDQQKINNWQRRGVSKDGALDAERMIGCPATWILDGKLPYGCSWDKLTLPASAAHPPCGRPEIDELLAIARDIDPGSVRALILLVKNLHGK